MTLDMIMEWASRIFAVPFVVLLVACGLWSVFMSGTALEEQTLQREARVAKRMGWLYLGLAITGFTVSRIYTILFP